MNDENVSKRRALLRSLFDGLKELDDMAHAEKDIKTGIDIENARESLIDGFEADVRGVCNDCGIVVLTGEMGQHVEDDGPLCRNCAASWADLKREWDEGREESEDGERDKFMADYQAHIAGGGSPDDKIVYEM